MLCDQLEGWNGVGGRLKREGPYVCGRLIHVDEWQKTTQYFKAIILQLKKINLNKGKKKIVKGLE